jgi:hypothetical protein
MVKFVAPVVVTRRGQVTQPSASISSWTRAASSELKVLAARSQLL